ncbi:MAG: TIGR03118 family protein, partial [Acidobacteriaceae bacterium]|nr:TIGR03118 family protein [Acidobacteriaceae bacterium]
MARPISVSIFAALIFAGAALGDDFYHETDLVSDIPGLAAQTDPNLVNPWGLVASGSSPFWVSDNGTGFSTLYNGRGTPQSLVVTLDAPDPTGIIANSGSNFAGSRFIFATESGTIAAWTPGVAGNPAPDKVSGAAGSVYKGLAINPANDTLYAANFGLGRIDVFNSSFAPTTAPGGFIDPTLPAG